MFLDIPDGDSERIETAKRRAIQKAHGAALDGLAALLPAPDILDAVQEACRKRWADAQEALNNLSPSADPAWREHRQTVVDTYRTQYAQVSGIRQQMSDRTEKARHAANVAGARAVLRANRPA